MPELPEVETVVRSLRPHVVDWTLLEVSGSGLCLRQPVDVSALRGQCGSRIVAIDRVGKYLLFRFSTGHVLVSHLGMTGRYVITPEAAPLADHTHLRLVLSRGGPKRPRVELRYIDPRRFGLAVMRGPGSLPEIDELGPDPLGPDFTLSSFALTLRLSQRALKTLLLDQSVVAGLGNIYVAEALFHARLRPTRRGGETSRQAVGRLHAAIRAILFQAVDRRGTTLSDGGYVDAEGQAGENQHHLMVYGRKGLPCRVCGATIRHLVQAQRSSYFCPTCQK